mmetsp:Transcript_11926/g.21391  ORF Transcript_11926/g.21391 Transcript_11926/m.21391 type:complete len:374 (-) Transcript_11926:20-1141(-)
MGVPPLEEVGFAVHGPVEEGAADEAAGADLVIDAVVDTLENTGHSDEDGGTKYGNVFDELGHVTAPEPNGHAAVEHELLGDAVEDVREGKVAEHDVGGAEVELVESAVVVEGSYAGNDGAVLEENAFRITRGTRGVHDGAKVVGTRGVGFDHVLGSELQKTRPGEHLDTKGFGGSNALRIHIVPVDNGTHIADLGKRLQKRLELLTGRKDGRDLGMVENVFNRIFSQTVIHWDTAKSHPVTRLHRKHPLRRVSTINTNTVLRIYPKIFETRTNLLDFLKSLGICLKHIRARSAIRIYSASTKAIIGGVVINTSFKKLVTSRNVKSWESILGTDVSKNRRSRRFRLRGRSARSNINHMLIVGFSRHFSSEMDTN